MKIQKVFALTLIEAIKALVAYFKKQRFEQ